MGWLERHRTSIIALLLAVIIAGGAVFLYRQLALPRSVEIAISPPSASIYVYVEGAVANPGVLTLREGHLVADAIDAAGGFSSQADRGSVNLAAPLRDGDQIHVYGIGEVPPTVNINTAEAWLLQALPGIGEVLAQRIIEYRTSSGPFRRIEDLENVDGIGQATIERLRDKVTVR